MAPALRTYIFDLDGTLIDSLPGIEQALSAAFTAIGRSLPPAVLARAIGPPIRIIASRLDPTLTDQDTAAIERIYRQSYDESAWKNTKLFPEVESTLRTLYQSGHELYIVTNKPTLPTARILAYLTIAGLFTDIVTRDSTSPPFACKPAMLAHLMERHNLSPEHSLLVGDTAEDAEAAATKSMPFVFMTYGYGEMKPSVLSGVRSLHHFSNLLAPEFRTA